MSETLANTEVGARLSPPRRQCAASTDAVQPYDFRRPRKLAKDPVRALELIHERFARLLSTTLATQLRTQTLVLAGIDQILTTSSCALPNPTVLVTFAFAAETGNALLRSTRASPLHWWTGCWGTGIPRPTARVDRNRAGARGADRRPGAARPGRGLAQPGGGLPQPCRRSAPAPSPARSALPGRW